MKKLLTVLISILLVVGATLGLTACGNGGFTAPTMVNWGEVTEGSLGSFVAETKNYVYFINGEGDVLADNTFGTPVKGSLMVLEKSALASGEVKSEVVVPKILITNESEAGVYLFGSGEETYAYYATPNTDKNSSGEIAKDEMVIARTRLDSKKTEALVTLPSHDSSYRIAEKDGVVYVVYHNSEDLSLNVYDTASKSSKVIAKTDAETNQATKIAGKDVYLTFNAYTLFENGSQYQAAYTVTVYTEKYYEEKAEKEGYSRATAKYNLLYLYSVGSEPVVAFDGSENNETFEIKFVENGYVFYNVTDLYSNVKTYGTLLSEIKDVAKRSVINDAELLTEGIIINSLSEVYYKDADADAIVKSSLVASNEELFLQKVKLASATNISSLICIEDGYLYYFNTDNYVARILLGDANANEERVSDGASTSTFYAPQIVTVDNDKYIFYIDASTEGCSYVEYVKINQTAKAICNKEDADKIDYYTLEGQTMVGEFIDSDIVKLAVGKITAIGTSVLDFEEEDGVLVVETVASARAAYDALSDELKEQVTEDQLASLEKAEKAVELANKYFKLKDVDNYADLTEEEQKAFKTLYEEAYAYRDALVQEGTDYYKSIRDMVASDYKYYYQSARKLFTK